MLRPCGSTDINSSINTIAELFSNNPQSMGILITKNSKYHGFLSARAIITIMNEENLLLARDQNPLTKLPGNAVIEQYLSQISQNNSAYLLCYFDLDNFKVFNDIYGFRNGDRIIQLFADLLKKNFSKDTFKAHIGGDDFFISFNSKTNLHFKDKVDRIENIILEFSQSAKKFYSEKDQKSRYVKTKDRDEKKKKFPLLTVSASVLEIRTETSYRCLENINNILSTQKKVAKASPLHIAISSLL